MYKVKSEIEGILRKVGKTVLIISVIAGLIAGFIVESFFVIVITIVSGSLTALMFMTFAEIINLLVTNANLLIRISVNTTPPTKKEE